MSARVELAMLTIQREGMEGIQERGGEETFYVGFGKQVRERASKERCLD